MTDEELEKLRKLIHTFKILDYTKEDIQTVLKIDEATLKRLCSYYDIL